MMKTIAQKDMRKYLPILSGAMLAVFSLGILIAPIAVFAQTDYTVLAPIPGTVNADGSTTNLGTYFAGFFRVAIAIAGVLAVLMIVIGGFQYATTDAIGNKQAGREKMKGALFGLLLAMSSFIILNTINPSLANIGLSNFGALQAPGWGAVFNLLNSSREKLTAFDQMIADGHIQNLKTKEDSQAMKTIALDYLSSEATAREILNKYYAGELSEQDKMTFFGTTDEAEISTQIAEITEKLNSTNLKAQNVFQDAEILEKINRNAVVIDGVRRINAYTLGDSDGLNFGNYIDAQRNAYINMEREFSRLEYATPDFKNTKLIEFRQKINKNISDMCLIYTYAQNRPRSWEWARDSQSFTDCKTQNMFQFQ